MVSRFYRPLIVPLIEHRSLGIAFLVLIIAATAGVCVLFYTQTVPVKMLPFDNKPEFSVVVNMPEGTALPETANALRLLAEKVNEMPEVTAVQTYAGTAQPFNFNGMVRHYYMRNRPWEGDLLVMLKDKRERELGSHALAVQGSPTPKAHRRQVGGQDRGGGDATRSSGPSDRGGGGLRTDRCRSPPGSRGHDAHLRGGGGCGGCG